jgi:hypothetical protein
LWRRSAIERIGGWNEGLICWQDWEFHVAALCAGIRYECIPAVLNYVRHHDGERVSWNRGIAQERSCLLAARLAHGYLSRAGLLNRRRRVLLSFYVVRHLAAIEAMRDPAKAALRREMIDFMEALAWTRRRKIALRLLRRVAGTPLFQKLLDVQMLLPGELHRSSLRNVVPAMFLPEPPVAVRELVSTSGTGVHPTSEEGRFAATGVPVQ